MDPYYRPIDPGLRFRCNRFVNGHPREAAAQPTFLSRVLAHYHGGGATDLSIFEGHKGVLDDVNVNVNVWKDRTYHDKRST